MSDVEDLDFDVKAFWNVYIELQRMPTFQSFWDDNSDRVSPIVLSHTTRKIPRITGEVRQFTD